MEGPAAQAEDRPESNAPALSEGSGVPSGPDAATAGRDATLQVIARAVNLGLGVRVTAMIARTLGTEGYGEWATLLAAVAAGMAFGITGERVARRTLIAACLAMIGIVIMVAGGLGGCTHPRCQIKQDRRAEKHRGPTQLPSHCCSTTAQLAVQLK